MHKERFGQDACASLVTLLGFQSRSFASETNNLSFEQLPALHLQTGVGHVQTEELQFRVANRLNQIPKVALPNGHSRQHLVRRVAVIVAASSMNKSMDSVYQSWPEKARCKMDRRRRCGRLQPDDEHDAL